VASSRIKQQQQPKDDRSIEEMQLDHVIYSTVTSTNLPLCFCQPQEDEEQQQQQRGEIRYCIFNYSTIVFYFLFSGLVIVHRAYL